MPEPDPLSTEALSFGEQLRRFRLRSGITQEELAERIGLASATISALERGVRQHPYPHTRQLLADAFGLEGVERETFIATTRISPPVSEPMKTNLPAPRNPLVGRAAHVAALCRLISEDDARLVTLTGVGGSGKTRLALAVGARLCADFPGGVWLVELAPINDSTLLIQTLASALGIQAATGVPLFDVVVRRLRAQPVLLVLDNCEHLVEQCAALVDQLLSSCASLHILATSREPLQVAGERQWRVPLLATPDFTLDLNEGIVTLADLAAYPAVELFVARARAVVPSFELTSENAAIVAHICAQLAGLPLAIELAAARVRVLMPAQILARLDDALRLLTGGSQASPTRQQTLRATLDWSYDLLDKLERTAFAQFSVFAGGFDLDAAETVCSSPELPAHAVLDLLSHLIDKSLVQVDDHFRTGATGARYQLLEPVRQYGLEHLSGAGALQRARSRQAAYCLALSERATPNLHGPDQLQWLKRLELERDNLRAALGWAEASGEATLGLRLAVALAPFWEARGYLTEGRRQVSSLLALPAASVMPTALRAEAFLANGRLAQWQTDLDQANGWLEESLALARSIDSRSIAAEALTYLGAVRMRQGLFDQAAILLEESLALYHAEGDRAGYGLTLVTLGVTVRYQHDYALSVRLLREGLECFRQSGDIRWMAIAQTMLASSLLSLGDTDHAESSILAGLTGLRTVGDRTFSSFGLLVLSEILATCGQDLQAARTLGATMALSTALGAPMAVADERGWEDLITSVRQELSPSAFHRAWSEGESLALDEILVEAAAAFDLASRLPASA